MIILLICVAIIFIAFIVVKIMEVRTPIISCEDCIHDDPFSPSGCSCMDRHPKTGRKVMHCSLDNYHGNCIYFKPKSPVDEDGKDEKAE